MNLQIRFDRRKLAALCRKHHIRRLAFFGSVLGRDFRPDSDIDALVEFEPGQVVGFHIFRVEEEFSHLLGGHPVDLVNPKYLNPRLKAQILADARVQYAEK